MRSKNASAAREQAPECRHSVSSNFRVYKRRWSYARTSADWQGMGYRAREDNLKFLLDSGSQRSFVRQDIAGTLNCRVRSTEHLNLFTWKDAPSLNSDV
ncbi:hypothetical protein HPB50_028486 [Hyalomma asiaticum]|nr:hypothetical protein HPB50_028486 [Hyalomma asiaticum]